MVWEKCGMARDRRGLEEAIATIPKLREQFWHEVSVPGEAKGAESGFGAGFPCGGFHGICRIALPRRLAQGGILWWAFPNRIPD